jgi:uncharacterized protein
MTSVRLLCFALLAIVASALPAAAQPAPPVLTAPVNDFAHSIDPVSAQELERLIRALQAATGDVVTVATVPTFQPYGDIRSYAVKMFENGGAGVGQKGKDNGLLVVVAIQDRKVAIEVGYTLEEYITDGFAGQTIRETILPEFRNGSYGAGLVAGVTRIINRLADARGVSLQDVPRTAPSGNRPSVRIPLPTILFVIFLIIMMSRRGGGRRRRYWGGGPWSGWNSGVGPFGGGFGGGFGGFGGGGGGGGGGGFGGFGGGRSGGGGASGGW